MRKKDESLRGKLLDLAREMAATSGPGSITIRAVAEKAGIATGTVYNYFSGKEDILLLLTEEYWRDALAEMQGEIHAERFSGQLEEIYLFLHKRIHQSAGMLMGSLRDVETAGRERMQRMHKELGKALVQRMEQDSAIRDDIWSEAFTREQYASFIVMNLMTLLRMDPSAVHFFIEIVKRTLY